MQLILDLSLRQESFLLQHVELSNQRHYILMPHRLLAQHRIAYIHYGLIDLLPSNIEFLAMSLDGFFLHKVLIVVSRLEHLIVELYVLLHHEELLSQGHKADTLVEVVLHSRWLKLVPNLTTDAI